MMIPKNLARLLVLVAVVGSTEVFGSADPFARLLLKNYLAQLEAQYSGWHTITCDRGGQAQDVGFDNCEQFLKLTAEGCYSPTTAGLAFDLAYQSHCDDMAGIKLAAPASVSYLDPGQGLAFWNTLPASIIPIAGGVYNDDGLAEATAERDRLVSGKRLEDIPFYRVDKHGMTFSGVIKRDRWDTCEIDDVLTLDPVLLADFDGDGVAELMVKRTRVEQAITDGCLVGSGSELGSTSTILITKPTADSVPRILTQLHPYK